MEDEAQKTTFLARVMKLKNAHSLLLQRKDVPLLNRHRHLHPNSKIRDDNDNEFVMSDVLKLFESCYLPTHEEIVPVPRH